MPTLDPTRYELPGLLEWPAGDSRELNFTVETNSVAKDLSNDIVTWHLLEKPYHSLADAVLSGDDPDVEVRTDTVVDPTAGEFRIDIAGGATSGLWGDYWQTIRIDPPGDDVQTFSGRVVIEDRGD